MKRSRGVSGGTRLIMEPRLELKEFGCTAAELCENSHFAFLHSHLHFSPPCLFEFHLLSRREIQGTDPVCSQAIPQASYRHPLGPASLAIPSSAIAVRLLRAASACMAASMCTSLGPQGRCLGILLKLPTLAADLEDPKVPKSPWTKQKFSLLYLCGVCMKIAETSLIKILDKGALRICA